MQPSFLTPLLLFVNFYLQESQQQFEMLLMVIFIFFKKSTERNPPKEYFFFVEDVWSEDCPFKPNTPLTRSPRLTTNQTKVIYLCFHTKCVFLRNNHSLCTEKNTFQSGNSILLYSEHFKKLILLTNFFYSTRHFKAELPMNGVHRVHR